MALLGKLPTKSANEEQQQTTPSEENNITTSDISTPPANNNTLVNEPPKPQPIKKVDPNNPYYEIPTEEKLSFNQSNVNFGEEMSYDDFDDDYDEDY